MVVVLWFRDVFGGGGFGSLEIIDTGSVDQETYINILTNRFHPWFTNVMVHQERDFIFQKDETSYHTGGYTPWWKKTQRIRGLEYSLAQSPNSNPM